MKHTKKNYPFLDEMKKEGWDTNKLNKHILISAYEHGLSSREQDKRVLQRLDIIIKLLSDFAKVEQGEQK